MNGYPVRITPAYAGNTDQSFQIASSTEDHPRIRGEHAHFDEDLILFLGSPPHTRGTQYAFLSLAVVAGITPAYAGNTLYKCKFNEIKRDHPRIRGEHPFELVFRTPVIGSPPHTRGTLK